MNAKHQPNTIVVGVDGSEASRAAFHRAIEEAVWRNANVRAVHVYEVPALTGFEMLAIDANSYREQADKWLTEELQYLSRSYEADFPVEVTGEISTGHLGVNLIRAAQNATMLVLGTRGLGGFRGLLLGSVTTYCVHHLPCPLLVVPDPTNTPEAIDDDTHPAADTHVVGADE
ncbi:MAG: universal stress protein [Acidimicrobiales bacterium]|nr:universal stress protein [Acidimicrobiales bacterium]